jgi:hypothetical protein
MANIIVNSFEKLDIPYTQQLPSFYQDMNNLTAYLIMKSMSTFANTTM